MALKTRVKAARHVPKSEEIQLYDVVNVQDEADAEADAADEEAEFAALQDEATELDVPIERDGRRICFEELKIMVRLAKEEAKELAVKRAAMKVAREAQEAAEQEAARVTRADGSVAITGLTGPLAAKRLAELRTRIRLPPDSLVKGLGLDAPSLADYELAYRHDYPVVIQGAKAYRTTIAMNDLRGGGEREAGSVILLIESHTRNKIEYLIPI
jgi:hypothetical protein